MEQIWGRKIKKKMHPNQFLKTNLFLIYYAKQYTGSPHIVRFHFVRFTLCATFGNSTLLSIKPHFVLKKIAQSEIYTNVHFVRNFTLCEFS